MVGVLGAKADIRNAEDAKVTQKKKKKKKKRGEKLEEKNRMKNDGCE